MDPRFGIGRAVFSDYTRPQMIAAIVQGAGTSASVRLDTSDGNSTTIDWGDGTVVSNASGATASHTYASAFTGNVKITAPVYGSKITRFDSSSGNWNFNLSSLPTGLTYFACYGSNTVSGDLSSLPTGLTYFACSGSNTVTFSGSWNASTIMRQVYVRDSSALSSSVVDALLNALAATVTSWITEKVVNIRGSRTSASDAAVATITGLGATVTVSP